jgi:aminoglycoside 6'-N-acetyltransferase
VVTLRPATPRDLETILGWAGQPHVIAAGANWHWDWRAELARAPSWREQLIAELEGRPIGFLQIMDPAGDPHRYWGEVPRGLRAIDLWIGEVADLGKGHGTQMMRLALERCFAEPSVSAVIIDPMASNTRAHRFYERLGFRFVERRRFPGDDEDCFVYRLERRDLSVAAVSETLFLPLYALALESRKSRPILVDKRAVDITRELDEVFRGSDRRIFRRLAAGRLPKALVSSLALRIRRYDAYVRAFLEREPRGIVVNLGCGLDTRRDRVDNGRMRWLDLDLPAVIDLRRGFFTETDRFGMIASSVLDLEWLDRLPDEPGRRFLFVAEGLFPYLSESGARATVLGLRERCPGAELVAEVSHRRIVRLMRSRLGRGRLRRQFGLSEDVVYRSGLEESRSMEGWAPGIALLGEWTYFDDPGPGMGWMRRLGLWDLFRYAQWTVHYRLGRGAEE